MMSSKRDWLRKIARFLRDRLVGQAETQV